MSILKKIFFLSIFLFLFSLLLWGIYVISFKKDTANTAQNNSASETPAATNAQKANVGKINAALDEPALSAIVLSDKIRYISKITKEAFEVNLDGSGKKNLGLGKIGNLTSAFWATDGQKIILKLNAGYATYGFDKNIQTPINKNVEDVYWQTNANRIFYKYYDTSNKERSLNVSDPDGSNWKKLADIPYRYLTVSSVPMSGLVSFWNSGDAWDETNFSTVPAMGGEVKTIFKSKFGADYLWNNDGTYVLISHTDQRGGNKMQLAMANSNGGEYKNLDIPTFVSKCAWSKDGKSVFYALPGNIPDNSILPNDYKNQKFNTADTFWKVDIFSGEKKRLVEPAEIKSKFDADKLSLNADESLLFFTNRTDGKLYKIAL